jgi:hypothetical protein
MFRAFLALVCCFVGSLAETQAKASISQDAIVGFDKEGESLPQSSSLMRSNSHGRQPLMRHKLMRQRVPANSRKGPSEVDARRVKLEDVNDQEPTLPTHVSQRDQGLTLPATQDEQNAILRNSVEDQSDVTEEGANGDGTAERDGGRSKQSNMFGGEGEYLFPISIAVAALAVVGICCTCCFLTNSDSVDGWREWFSYSGGSRRSLTPEERNAAEENHIHGMSNSPNRHHVRKQAKEARTRSKQDDLSKSLSGQLQHGVTRQISSNTTNS